MLPTDRQMRKIEITADWRIGKLGVLKIKLIGNTLFSAELKILLLTSVIEFSPQVCRSGDQSPRITTVLSAFISRCREDRSLKVVEFHVVIFHLPSRTRGNLWKDTPFPQSTVLWVSLSSQTFPPPSFLLSSPAANCDPSCRTRQNDTAQRKQISMPISDYCSQLPSPPFK